MYFKKGNGRLFVMPGREKEKGDNQCVKERKGK